MSGPAPEAEGPRSRTSRGEDLTARALRYAGDRWTDVVVKLERRAGPRLMSWIRKRLVILRNPQATIRFHGPVYLGPGFSLRLGRRATFVVGRGVEFRRGFHAEVATDATLVIRDRCVFTYGSVIQCTKSIELGERSALGQASLIVDSPHRWRDMGRPIRDQGYEHRPIRIGSDVTMYAKATVQASIGDRSIVSGSSLVTRPVPPYCIVSGNPARIVRYFGPPELEPAEIAEHREVVPARERRLEVSGHSVAFGGGASSFDRRYTSRLADLIGAEEANRSVGGAVACRHETGERGDGGWARALGSMPRPADPEAGASPGRVGVAHYGVNDLAALGPHQLGPFRHALRAIVSRHRASAVFEEDHDSVRADGDWETRRLDGSASGDRGLAARSPSATLAIDVPGSFPGGHVAIGFVAEPRRGAAIAFEVDGEPAGTLDTRGAADVAGEFRNAAVQRIGPLAPGPHAIACSIVDDVGPVLFDYWQIEPPDAAPVLVPLAHRPLSYDPWQHWRHTPNDADVARLNAEVREVAGEFDGAVVVVDMDAVMAKDPENFVTETTFTPGVYPNDRGHELMAEAARSALEAAVPDSISAARRAAARPAGGAR